MMTNPLRRNGWGNSGLLTLAACSAIFLSVSAADAVAASGAHDGYAGFGVATERGVTESEESLDASDPDSSSQVDALGYADALAQYFDNRPPQRSRQAQPYSQPMVGQQANNHDSGFLLRLSMGLGGAQSRYSEGSSESFRLTGFGVDWNIAIGGFVAPNFALHATFLGFAMPDPKIRADGMQARTSSNVTTTIFGGGITYYFMPANVYLTASLGGGMMRVETRTAYGETGFGIGGDVAVGKEWFVGPSWGLGIAGGFTWHSFPDDLIDSRWNGGSATVRFTASFNP